MGVGALVYTFYILLVYSCTTTSHVTVNRDTIHHSFIIQEGGAISDLSDLPVAAS